MSTIRRISNLLDSLAKVAEWDGVMFSKEYKDLLRKLKKRQIGGNFCVMCIVIKAIVSNIITTFYYYYYTKIKSKESFTFQGRSYYYFYHKYNSTWRNERAIEIPIIWNIVKEAKDKIILEVGNVLSHYFDVDYDIVDKYEKAEAVINEDIVNFHPPKKYDLIVSISTLEHVGWDEDPRVPSKVIKAIENLRELLSLDGRMIITLPLGYNCEIDKFLMENRLGFDKKYYLKRISRNNKWIETTWDNICDIRYGEPFPNANALVIGVIERK